MTTLLPSTDRLLRGVRSALAELDVEDRPDLAHAIGMVQLALGHVCGRSDPDKLRALHADVDMLVRETQARIASPEILVPPASGGADFDDLQAAVGEAFAALDRLVGAARQAGWRADDPLWGKAQALERRFYAAVEVVAPPPAGPAPLSRQAFEAYLHDRFPGAYRGVTAFRRLVGGFQKETILVDAESAAGERRELVIRAEKHDRFVDFTASAIIDEYPIVRMLWNKGFPVAEPLWLESDAAKLGRRFMVSRRARGVNTGSAYGTGQRAPEALVRSFMRTLATLHALPHDAEIAATRLGDWLRFPTLAENTRAEIAAWRHQIWLDRAPPSPTFTRVFDWLEDNIPPDDAPQCVLHNDYGPHNILVDGDAVSAVLDWEVPRIGDPAGDVSFFLQCAGSAIDRDFAIACYEESGGQRISPFRLAYFDVLSIGKVLVSTLSATTMYQATEPALIDWLQMPLLMHGPYQQRAEDRIAAAERCRTRRQ